MMIERKLMVGALAFASLLGGCTLAPKYARPEAPVSASFPNAPQPTEGEITAAELGWRDVFPDERLQTLVALALENNRDLRVAALNVERVQALYRIRLAPLVPAISAGAAATFQELPSNLPNSQFAPTQQYSVSLGTTAWELDFFGRIRSLSEQALQTYFATAEARRSAQLAIVSQVVTADFDARATVEQLELARQTLETVESSYALTQRAFELGTANELDLRTSQSQVETARFNFAFYEQRRAQAVNALVFLIGRPLPEDLPAASPLAETPVMANVPAGIPSDLLQRRPDILAAEYQLRAANASIGAARAAFFPSITLTGAAGLASTDLATLFTGGAFTWNFLPRINVPIFQGGALKASLDVAEISKQIEVANYERSIQVAFREVADALATREAIEKRLVAQRARVEAEQRRYQLADQRYRAGIERYVTVLTAQRDLYSAQQQLIDTQFSKLANVAALYRALGGGWNERTPTAANGAQSGATEG